MMWLDEIEKLIQFNIPFKNDGPMFMRHDDVVLMARVLRELAGYTKTGDALRRACGTHAIRERRTTAYNNLSDDARELIKE